MLFLPRLYPLQYPLAIGVNILYRLTLQLHDHTLVKRFSRLLCQYSEDLRVEVLL